MRHKSEKYFRNNKLIDRTLKEHPKKSVDEIQAYQDFIKSVYNNKNVEEMVNQVKET